MGPNSDGGAAEGAIFKRYFASKAFAANDCTMAFLSNENDTDKEGSQIIKIANPFDGKKHLLIRIRRKLYSILHKNSQLIGSSFILKQLVKKTKGQSFQAVVGIGGWFSALNAAFLYSKKTKTPFYPLYLDSFLSNPSFKGKKETLVKWDSLATAIFYDPENVKISQVVTSKKYIPINLPFCDFPEDYTSFEELIVYGGLFYPGIREPTQIMKLASNPIFNEYSFRIYTNSKIADSIPPNVSVLPMQKQQDFQKILQKAKALILVNNISSNFSAPSKIYEMIAARKIIISINPVNCPQLLSSYPFVFFYGVDKPEKLRDMLDNFSPALSNSIKMPNSIIVRETEGASADLLDKIATSLQKQLQ